MSGGVFLGGGARLAGQFAQPGGGCDAGFGSHRSHIERRSGCFKVAATRSRSKPDSRLSWLERRTGSASRNSSAASIPPARTRQAVHAPHPASLLPRLILVEG